MTTTTPRFIRALAVGIAFVCGTVSAQDEHQIPEVVVTAPAIEEVRLDQENPDSRTAFSERALEMRGVRTAEEATLFVPNVNFTDTGSRGYGQIMSARGLTNTQFFGSPATVVYVDDVPYGDAFAYAGRLFAVEELEFSRGLQGTRFGLNAYAGAVDVRTRQAGDEWDGWLSLGGGSYNRFEADAALMGPLVKDKLYLSLSGAYFQRDGFVRNTFTGDRQDDAKNYHGRGTLTWKPSDEWTIALTAGGDWFRDGATRLVSLDARDAFTVASDADEALDINANYQALKVGYAGDGFEFLSVTARREWNLDTLRQDLDFSPLPIASSDITQDQEQWSQELRFQSPADSERWDWRAGAFFSTRDTRHEGGRTYLVPPIFLTPISEVTSYTLDDRTIAGFGHVAYKGWDKVRLSAGLRADYVEKEMDRTKASPLPGATPFQLKDDYFGITPKLGLEVDTCENTTVYATTGYGFKPGGFSAFTNNPDTVAYDNERSWTSEAGLKTNAWDGRLQANLVAFYSRIDDYQVERSVDFADYVVLNADRARAWGAEFELAWELAPGLTLDGSLGYTNTRFQDFTDPLSGEDLSGNQFPFVPEFDWSTGLEYRHSSGFFGRVEFVGVGDTYFDDFNREDFRQSSYGILNVKLGYENERFAIYGFASNLTDETYFTNKTPEIRAGTPGAPQQFGVKLSVFF